MPAFNDAHQHLLPLGLGMRHVNLRPEQVRTLDELLSRISAAVRAAPKGAWVLFTVVDDRPAVWAQFRSPGLGFAFGGKQVHDAYQVATMLTYGIRRLLTFNAKHFRRFEPLIEVIEP